MSLPEPFHSQTTLHQTFIEGLERQLAEPGLGTFILVLANASFDPAIWPSLRPRLERRFDELTQDVRAALRAGFRLEYPDDDLMVFLKLVTMGFDAVTPTERRQAGPWELLFNPLRALRPARASGQAAAGVEPPPFNPAGFHFKKSFLSKEILWEGKLLNRVSVLLYNKFPFAPYHGLLVPDPDKSLPQRLTQEHHLYAWHLVERLGAMLPGFGVSYNSYGACASVNHLHFQTFIRERGLPLADPAWRHNGGTNEYPAACRAFESALDAWFFLEDLHRRNMPYNLIYTAGRIYGLMRRPQGGHEQATWNLGFAWQEMAGGIMAFSQELFTTLSEDAISGELRRTRPV